MVAQLSYSFFVGVRNPYWAPGPPVSSMAIWCFQPPLCLSGDVSSLLTAACSTSLLHFYHQGESFPIRPSPTIRGCPDGGPKRHEEWYLWAEARVRNVLRGRWSLRKGKGVWIEWKTYRLPGLRLLGHTLSVSHRYVLSSLQSFLFFSN